MAIDLITTVTPDSITTSITRSAININSTDRRQKNFRIRKKTVYTTKLSGFKSFRIQSSHFKVRIQNLRRHDQAG